MAPALQCPACGFKHRLDAVADTPVFPCARCSRQLKVPGQFRHDAEPGSVVRPAPSRTAGASGPTTAASGRPRSSSSSPRSSIKGWRPAGTPMRLPVRILLWVIAFILSALIVRSFAKWTGIAGSQQVLDSMIDKGFGTYFRLFILVPIWGLFATLLATALIDGPGWWARRSARTTPPLKRKVPAAAGVGAGVVVGSTSARSSVARKVPTRSPARDGASTRSPAQARSSAAATGAAATTSTRTTRQPATEPAPRSEPTIPSPDQRPRRIPRRDTGS